MSGEFVTLAEAILITGRAAPGTNTFYVDMPNLQQYMMETSADQLRIQKGLNTDGSETLVLTCYRGGNPVYHIDGSGNQCVLEHILIPPTPPTKA